MPATPGLPRPVLIQSPVDWSLGFEYPPLIAVWVLNRAFGTDESSRIFLNKGNGSDVAAINTTRTPSFNPIPKPTVVPSSAPQMRQSTRKFSAMFFTDGPPLEKHFGGEFSTVRAIAKVIWNPAMTQLQLEEML